MAVDHLNWALEVGELEGFVHSFGLPPSVETGASAFEGHYKVEEKRFLSSLWSA